MKKNKFNRQSLGLFIMCLLAVIGFIADFVYFKSGLGASIALMPIAGRFIYRNSGEGGAGGAAQTEQEVLLGKINERVKKEIENRGYQNADNVQALVTRALEGLNLDALRKYDTEKEALNLTIRNIAGELEKVKNSGGIALEQRVGDNLKVALENEMGAIELIQRQKQMGQQVMLNVRAVNMTTDNVIDEGDLPIEAIESMSMAAFVPKRRANEFIYDIVDRTIVQEITQFKTWLEEGSESGAFAIVAEGAVKPLVSLALVRNFAETKKIAGKYVVTEEFTKFRKEAFTIIKRLINDKLLRDFADLLVVDLNAQAAGYVGTTLDGTITDPTRFDAIGAVAAQIETLNFVPDVIVLHPQDKWSMALEKDSEGRYYMMIPMMGADGIVRMMGFRVITSTKQTIGSFTLGESGLFKVEEEPITVRIGYGIDVTTVEGNVTAVTSDFDNNRLRVIVETYFNDWIATNHIGSFVKASFATVQTALETV